ncbi:MAG TPA: hypothetical protein VFS88_06065 [Micavibrio sp.]|nr:hypothetical protein [Micavibrio sp.]
MRIIMRKSTVYMIGFALVALSMATAKAEPAVSTTTTTEIQSPDGTTTTVIAPGAAAPQAVPAPAATAATGTTVVVDPPVAIDAITGKPVSNTTAPAQKDESLRDRVRDKIEKNN